MFKFALLSMLICTFTILCTINAETSVTAESKSAPVAAVKTDLDTSATSAKLLNLFGQQQPYYYNRPAYSNGYYPSTSSYYPSSGSYYPSTGSWTGSYYPNYNYNPSTYPSSYPSTYPNNGYYPTTTGGSYYPTNSYYPSGGVNMLGGNGGYGGYGGNGGLRQYSGYWNPDYMGQRNRGYGYFAETDRFGLPNYDRSYETNRNGFGYNGGSYGAYAGSYGNGIYSNSRDRDRLSVGGYRGYD